MYRGSCCDSEDRRPPEENTRNLRILTITRKPVGKPLHLPEKKRVSFHKSLLHCSISFVRRTYALLVAVERDRLPPAWRSHPIGQTASAHLARHHWAHPTPPAAGLGSQAAPEASRTGPWTVTFRPRRSPSQEPCALAERLGGAVLSREVGSVHYDLPTALAGAPRRPRPAIRRAEQCTPGISRCPGTGPARRIMPSASAIASPRYSGNGPGEPGTGDMPRRGLDALACALRSAPRAGHGHQRSSGVSSRP